MVYKSRSAAMASLREFTPWLRKKHKVERFWSTTQEKYLWTRVLAP